MSQKFIYLVAISISKIRRKKKIFKFLDIWLVTLHMAFYETFSQTFTCLLILTVSDFPRFLHFIFSLVLLYYSVSKIFHFYDYDLFHSFLFSPILRRSWPNWYHTYNTFVVADVVFSMLLLILC